MGQAFLFATELEEKYQLVLMRCNVLDELLPSVHVTAAQRGNDNARQTLQTYSGDNSVPVPETEMENTSELCKAKTITFAVAIEM